MLSKFLFASTMRTTRRWCIATEIGPLESLKENNVVEGVSLRADVPMTVLSKSQSNIAVSNGEAELNSSIVINETLGVINL